MCRLTKVRLTGRLGYNYNATVYESDGTPVQIKHTRRYATLPMRRSEHNSVHKRGQNHSFCLFVLVHNAHGSVTAVDLLKGGPVWFESLMRMKTAKLRGDVYQNSTFIVAISLQVGLKVHSKCPRVSVVSDSSVVIA